MKRNRRLCRDAGVAETGQRDAESIVTLSSWGEESAMTA